jgi:hypothetical protein
MQDRQQEEADSSNQPSIFSEESSLMECSSSTNDEDPVSGNPGLVSTCLFLGRGKN